MKVFVGTVTLQPEVTISSWKPSELPCAELSPLLGRPEQHTAALGLRQSFVLSVLELNLKMATSAILLLGVYSRRPLSLPCSLLPTCPHVALPLRCPWGPEWTRATHPHFNATASGKAQHPKPATAYAGGATQPLGAPMLSCSMASSSWALATGRVCPGSALRPD